jgi:hypothetical protein
MVGRRHEQQAHGGDDPKDFFIRARAQFAFATAVTVGSIRFATAVTVGNIRADHSGATPPTEDAMSRSSEYEIGSDTELMLAETIDRLELALIPVCPDPGPARSAAQLAHARACLDADEEFQLLLDAMLETPAHGSRQTRH